MAVSPDAWTLAGRQRNTGLELSVLVAATAENRDYIAGLVFGGACDREYVGAVVTDDGRVDGRAANGCSLAIVEATEAAAALDGRAFVIPAWVMTEVDVPCPPSVITDSGVKSDLRRIRRAALRYELTREDAAIEDFYVNMYLPFARHRHGAATILMSRDHIRRYRQRLELLLVNGAEGTIGGGLIFYDGLGARLSAVGVRDGDARHLANGVIGATYYFSFEYLAAKGYSTVRLGFSRPFVYDGVMRYKRKWGHRITVPGPGRFVLTVLSLNAASRGFLENNPYVYETPDGLQVAAFVDASSPDSTRAQLEADCAIPGIATLTVHHTTGDALTTREVIPLEPRRRAYWHATLAAAGRVDLPADVRGGGPGGPAWRLEHATIPRELVASLGAVADAAACPPVVALTAALAVLLGRLAGATDVPIVAARPAGGDTDSHATGADLATILRADLSGAPTFPELLRRVGEQWSEAWTNGVVPFRDVPKILAGSALPPPAAAVVRAPARVTAAQVNVSFADDRDVLRIGFEYDAARFAPARAAEMVRQYVHLLRMALANPDESIERLSLVTDEATRILPDPVAPLSDAWRGSVPSLAHDVAARDPNHVAIVDAGGVWTYRALDDRSGAVARTLRQAGVQPGDVVAIYAHRSAPLVVAVLGVLKAGAAFLILDPAYPPDRLRRYLAIAAPAAWIQIAAAGPLDPSVDDATRSGGCKCRMVLGSTRSPAEPEASHATGPIASIEAGSLAYVAFTSGSTGTPKAVLGAHGSLSHFIPWQAEAFDLTGADRFTMLSGLAHDPLHRDMFTPLQIGAAICIPSPEEYGHPARLLAWMRNAGVTVAHMTPGIVRMLTGEPDAEPIPALRLAFVVGDLFTTHDVHRLQRLAPNLTCVSLYGTTETQRAVSYFVLPRRQADAAADRRLEESTQVPLGVGIPDVQLLVLNRASRLAGIGEVGEICVRSPHLARGYLADRPLTERHFTPNPISGEPSDRLYRTGDLGRYRPDGQVEFAGRADRQIKIRGHRVEPREIEVALSEHDEVIDAVVAAREDGRNESRLLAYVVMDNGSRSAARHLRPWLARRLPDHMIPAAFVPLEKLPLTPNGKVDHDALRSIDIRAAMEPAAADAPRSPIHGRLAEIWREVLGVSAIGIHDDFFDLGGHSLSGMQILTRVSRDFNVELSIDTVFDAPTIAQFANAIDSARRGMYT